MTIHECPECGEPMEFQEAEPEVGIPCGYWFCYGCTHTLAEESYDEDLE
jgi:hypothetical protein